MTSLSRHAQQRAQQRGVLPSMIDVILDHADVERDVGNGCTLFRISKRRAPHIPDIEKLSRFAVIWSDSCSQVVTVLPINNSPSGRRYRSRRGDN